MKYLTFLIGILFVCQMAFSQTTGKQIIHDDFDTNVNGWQNCTITNGQLLANEQTCLKAIDLSEDFMIRTLISVCL